MHRTITADIDAPPQRVFDIVSDLETYAEWLDVVDSAEPAPADSTDAGPAWFVTIKAKIGPFARSKRLRMVRTEQTETSARFERHELDGREHSAWTMESVVAEGPRGSTVSMELSYDGGLWDGPLDAILGSVAGGAGDQLAAYATR